MSIQTCPLHAQAWGMLSPSLDAPQAPHAHSVHGLQRHPGGISARTAQQGPEGYQRTVTACTAYSFPRVGEGPGTHPTTLTTCGHGYRTPASQGGAVLPDSPWRGGEGIPLRSRADEKSFLITIQKENARGYAMDCRDFQSGAGYRVGGLNLTGIGSRPRATAHKNRRKIGGSGYFSSQRGLNV